MTRRRGSSISEGALQLTVIDMAKVFGWKVMHTRPAHKGDGSYTTPIQGDPGFPDLVLARKGTIMFVELKSESGDLMQDQLEWRDALNGPDGIVWWCWRPEDLTSDRIQEALR